MEMNMQEYPENIRDFRVSVASFLLDAGVNFSSLGSFACTDISISPRTRACTDAPESVERRDLLARSRLRSRHVRVYCVNCCCPGKRVLQYRDKCSRHCVTTPWQFVLRAYLLRIRGVLSCEEERIVNNQVKSVFFFPPRESLI